MEQTGKEVAEDTGSTPGRMDAGDTGYGSVQGRGQPGGAGGSETAPLLIPEPAPGPEPVQHWKPMTKQELESAAGGPGWRKMRCYLVLLFWLAWVAMLAGSIAIIVMSPRPAVVPLKWWQKSLFYRLQPDLFMEAQTEGSGGINAMCEQLPYLKSLGIGALILEGLFDEEVSPLDLNNAGRFGALPQIKHLIAASTKTGLKMVLDLCELDLLGPHDVSRNTATIQHALRFWLEQGVAGFAICDNDAAYSEKTLLEWRDVINEFSSKDEERIVVVKQTRDVLLPLNFTLVNLVMRTILPSSRHHLSTPEVAAAIKTRLQTTEENIWPSWTIGGKASHDLKKLLLVLMMTMPGSPAVQYDDAIGQTQNESLKVSFSHEEKNESSDTEDKLTPNSTVALFSSLSRSRAREEAILYGSLTFLPYRIPTNSSSNSTLSYSPILAFLRSWGCVHFLVLLNVGSEFHILDPAWDPGLHKEGVFVASTGMDRLGPISLNTLELQPHEAVVIKF
ncbi:4F2 cell-surface antigen heavy chain [Anabas testudineus]|uniref:4F2 cell-surface antigen heavy chain n=1 Tax=Anabas testudineus TaxID=64144 RepID=UPI000E45D256|nr:4F2 cell-surface antigen heavy chain [Anabas testudineus]